MKARRKRRGSGRPGRRRYPGPGPSAAARLQAGWLTLSHSFQSPYWAIWVAIWTLPLVGEIIKPNAETAGSSRNGWFHPKRLWRTDGDSPKGINERILQHRHYHLARARDLSTPLSFQPLGQHTSLRPDPVVRIHLRDAMQDLNRERVLAEVRS